MEAYKTLAISNPADLRFGFSPRPLLTRNGLAIGGGTVYPELNFTLPPMFVDASTMNEVRQHYRRSSPGRAAGLPNSKLPGSSWSSKPCLP